MIVDLFLIYQFLKRLATPFNKWDAYKHGVIDDKGNILKSRKDFTSSEKNSFGRFDVMILNMKKLLGKVPGGRTAVASYAAALLLLKESQEENFTPQLKDLNEEIANVTSNVQGINDGNMPRKKKKKILKRMGIQESYYYHGTTPQIAQKFKKEGIDPSKSLYSNKIFLTKNHTEAQKYSKIANNGKLGTVVRVHTSNINKAHVLSDRSGIIEYTARIPSHHIKDI